MRRSLMSSKHLFILARRLRSNKGFITFLYWWVLDIGGSSICDGIVGTMFISVIFIWVFSIILKVRNERPMKKLKRVEKCKIRNIFSAIIFKDIEIFLPEILKEFQTRWHDFIFLIQFQRQTCWYSTATGLIYKFKSQASCRTVSKSN